MTSQRRPRIGLVSDSAALVRAIEGQLARAGVEGDCLASASIAEAGPCDILLLDPNLSDPGLLDQVHQRKDEGCAVWLVVQEVSSSRARSVALMAAGAARCFDLTAHAEWLADALTAFGREFARSSRGGAVSAVSRRVNDWPPLLLIGCSAGGPATLREVLGSLPRDFPAAILIAQHIHDQFVVRLVDSLRSSCQLPVAVAEAGGFPLPGRVDVARALGQISFGRDGKYVYGPEPLGSTVTPNIDAMFLSANQHGAQGAALILSGMGKDGAAGLRALRDAGWATLAEDALTARVGGMPRAAALSHGAAAILDRSQIGSHLQRWAEGLSPRVPAPNRRLHHS